MGKKLEFKLLAIIVGIVVLSIIASSIGVLYMERSDIYAVAKERLEGTASVITTGIEHTMLAGDPSVTKDFVAGLKNLDEFESIGVFNDEGREAFNPEAPRTEAQALKRLSGTKTLFSQDEWDKIVFYMPLLNKQTCFACHGSDKPLQGAVKITMTLEKEKARMIKFLILIIVGSLLTLTFMSLVFARILRRFVISPLKTLGVHAEKMAEGDLTFKSGITVDDEIGRLDVSIKESLSSLSGILSRVRDISDGVAGASDAVSKDSSKVVKGTDLEAEAVSDMSSSVEELNSAISEIADSTESLATSVEESAASIEQMATNVSSVTKISHELSGGIDETSTAINEMSAAIREIASNAEDLAAVSEETLSAIDEITSSVKEVEQHAKESAKLSSNVTSDAAELGVPAIEKTVAGMKKIQEAVDKTAEAVHSFAERSEEIGDITKIIDEITDQTTLLALNAAIIAAQAGEHGKGFSVVAGEIRDLADRTAISTQEISQLVQGVRNEVRAAVQAMAEGMTAVNDGIEISREASAALNKILDSSKKSTDMAFSIERTTTEQANAARSVSAAMERVRMMVDQIAAATSQQSKGVTHVIEASDKMRDAAHQVDVAMAQQAAGSRQISQSVDVISDRTQEISRAIYEQKVGANQIWNAIEKMKDIPKENRDLAQSISSSIQNLNRDTEFLKSEMTKFKLYDDLSSTVMRLGIVPHESTAELHERFIPLLKYLGKSLGKKVDLRVEADYATAMEDLKKGATQMCFLGVFNILRAHREHNVGLLATVLTNGRLFNRAAFVTKEGSEIDTIESLRGQSVAFGDPGSTTGYMVPLHMLGESGVSLDDLSRHAIMRNHEAVANAVLKGKFDAGAMKESLALRYEKDGLKIVALSDDIPESTFCVSSAIDENDRNIIERALLSLSADTEEGAGILKSLDSEYTGTGKPSVEAMKEFEKKFVKGDTEG